MFHKLALVVAVGVGFAATAEARRIVFPILSPIEKVAHAEMVVTGKISVVEDEQVWVPAHPGSEKALHKVAIIKVEKGLFGAKETTHVKILFVPQPHLDAKVFVQPQGRGVPRPVNIVAGHGGVFFLTKHPTTAGYYHVEPMLAPLDAKADGYKTQMEVAAKAAAALADPAKALKAEKADDRFLAAVTLLHKFNIPPSDESNKVTTASLSGEESRPILKALAEGSWKEDKKTGLNGYRAFVLLWLGTADGWTPPKPEEGKDYPELARAAFIKWLDGAGKNYRIKKLTLKTPGK